MLASLRPDRGKPEFHRDLARRYVDSGQWREAAAALRAALNSIPPIRSIFASHRVEPARLAFAGRLPLEPRSTASILSTLGMEDWIAHSAVEYAQLAAEHAARTGALAELRAGLWNRLEHSILMDGERFTRQLEALYRRMWRERGTAAR